MKSWPLQVPVLITNDLTSAHPHSVHVWKVEKKVSKYFIWQTYLSSILSTLLNFAECALLTTSIFHEVRLIAESGREDKNGRLAKNALLQLEIKRIFSDGNQKAGTDQ